VKTPPEVDGPAAGASTCTGPGSDERFARLLEIEQEVALLNHATRARGRVLTERFDPDLQPAGFSVLRYVIVTGPVRAGGIASALSMDKSAVSRQITVLRDAGLLQTSTDPEDGRATLLVATETAETALAAFRQEMRAEYERIMHSWETADVAAFARLLRLFNTSRD